MNAIPSNVTRNRRGTDAKGSEKKTHDRLVKINIEYTVKRFLRMGRNKVRQ